MPRDSSHAPVRRTSRLMRVAVALLWALIACAGFAAFFMRDLPPLENTLGVRVYAADGTLLATRGGGLRVPYERLPPALLTAVVDVEDRRFYRHFGLDPIGIARALVNNLRGGHTEGGSTITQQLAKNMFLSPQRTLGRKIREAFLALLLEARYSKQDILALYLNKVYFGAGATGIEAAARRYFNKAPEALNLSESAMLAGLLRAPSRYSPADAPERAEGRAATVLQIMHELGHIDEAAYRTALTDPAASTSLPADEGTDAFVEQVLAEAAEYAGELREGTRIDTSLDVSVQRAAADALRNRVRGEVDGGVLVLASDGAMLGYVGGKRGDGFDRVSEARRQSGSAFKTFVYAAALEAGRHPDDLIDDTPLRINGYAPRNHDGRYAGPVTLRTAFARSMNVPAVRLAYEVGLPAVRSTAARFGVLSPVGHDLSAALGTDSLPLRDLTAGYLPFVAYCRAHLPYAVRRIELSGQTLYKHGTSEGSRAADPAVCTGMRDLLRAVTEEGTGLRAHIAGVEIGGKTGTASDNRDALFVGYVGDRVIGVRVGRDDGASMPGISGGTLPAQIWRDTALQNLHRTDAAAPPPDPSAELQSLTDETPSEH